MEKISESILKFLRLDNIIQHVTGYVEARFALMKAEIREDVALTIARSMVMVALFFMGFLFLIFFSIGLAQFLNRFFEESYSGYWSIAGVYGAIFLILLVFRKGIYQYFEHKLLQVLKRKEK